MRWPVLLMARALDAGGSERQMTEIAKALDRSRFDHRVGCFHSQGMRGAELIEAGVPVIEFPVRSYLSAGAVSGAFQLGSYIRRNQIRLVHAWDYPLNVFAAPVTRLMTRAVAVTSQRGHRDLTPRSHMPLLRASDRFADAIVVNCEFLRKHLEHDERVSPRKIRLCYNGLDTGVFYPLEAPRPEALSGASFVIGVVCSLRPEKGLPTLVEAFARVRRPGSRIKLLVVGSGPALPELQSLAGSLGIGDDCVFVGGAADVAPWLRAIDVFVLPSLTEALSNSIMEAMACGCCVVASRVGGNPELVRDMETGVLFECGDAASLSAAIEKLIADEPLRMRLAEAGSKNIRENFSIRASAARMGEIYAELLASRPA